MKNLFRLQKLFVLVGGLSLLGACGGVEGEEAEEGMQQQESAVTVAACTDYVKQFTGCVHQANLNGVASCGANEYRASVEIFAWCTSTTAKAVKWTCCPL
jgi:cobalamin biosynthesis protein CbiD